MMIDYNLRKNIPILPGDTIAEYLEVYSMTQKELAQRVGMTPKAINEVIAGKTALTPQLAIKLENVFDVPASFWNNLECNYRENLLRIEEEKNINEETSYLKQIAYNEIAKLGWVAATGNVAEQVANLRKFFSVSSLDNINTVMGADFRRKDKDTASIYSLVTWIRKGEIDAREIDVTAFDKEKVIKSIEKFRSLTLLPIDQALIELKKVCAECGIALVIVPHLKKTYVNGATRWLNENKAMIELSKRYKYIDIFWFTFFHELGHILKHSKKENFVDESDNGENTNKDLEIEADKFAADALIEDKIYRKFTRDNSYFDAATICAFAQRVNVSPCIVIGRLAHDSLIPHNVHNNLRPRFC